jgi:ribokinase
VSHVVRLTHAPSGVALITVAHDGENSIVVSPGANGHLDADAVRATITDLAGPDTILLTQLEVPLAVVLAAAEATASAGGRVAVNLSPAQSIPESLVALCDPLVVNESEARMLGAESFTDVAGALDAARALATRARSVIITLGGEGAVWCAGDAAGHVSAPTVPVVDTTGAGDAFVGAVCAALADGAEFSSAVRAGVTAGSAAVGWVGAQPRR